MPIPSLVALLDDGTGTFPIDISRFVMSSDGYSISRGRDDWQGAVTAGELTLTLNNSDGRFTPGSTILGSPSPIKVDQRIRISVADSAGFGAGGFGVGVFGGMVNRFTGYVKSWPVAWPATVATMATVALTATDAQARAERWTLRSLEEEEILQHGPSALYTLSEPAGAEVASDCSGNAAPALAPAGSGAALTFGDENGVAFAGGQYLQPVAPASGAVATFGCRFVGTALPPGPSDTMIIAATDVAFIRLRPDGLIDFVDSISLLGPTGPQVADGLIHEAVMTFTGTTGRAFLDGQLIGSWTSTAVPTYLAGVGGVSPLVTGAVLMFGTHTYSGAISHAFTNAAALAPATVADLWTAYQGFAGEQASARVARLAAYSQTPTGTIDTSATALSSQETAGSSAWEAIQEAADAEMGIVYIDDSGALTFLGRADPAGKTAPDLVLDSQYLTPDVQPVVDDQRIVNYFEASAAGSGGAAQVVVDQASQDLHGRYPEAQTYAVPTDRDALNRGSWIVAKQAEPGVRYGTLTINLYKMSADAALAALATLELGCWLRVTSLASQNPGGTVADVVVQGWQEAATGESWAIACNVVSRSLYTALILDDPVFGALDSYQLLV